MKKWTIINAALAAVSLVAMCVTLITVKSAPEIAYVDNGQIWQNYSGLQESADMYKEKLKVWQSRLDTLEHDLDYAFAQYQGKRNQLSREEQMREEAILNNMKQNFFAYKEKVQNMASEEDQRMTDAVLNQIDGFMLNYGEESGYDYIIGLTNQGNLLYAREQNNITQEILNGLNNAYAGK